MSTAGWCWSGSLFGVLHHIFLLLTERSRCILYLGNRLEAE